MAAAASQNGRGGVANDRGDGVTASRQGERRQQLMKTASDCGKYVAVSSTVTQR